MERAELLNRQMWELFGENRAAAEPVLWIASVSLGILFCKSVYEILEAHFSQMKVYKSLTREQQIEWNNRGFSTAHAILMTCVAGYMFFFSDFFFDSAPYGPVVFRSSIFSQTFLGVSIGYFITDMFMIVWFYPALGGWIYLLHHGLSVISLALAVHSGYAHFYLYMILLSEFTTPFVNLRWYLSLAGLSNSHAYIINGILMFFSWLLFRVVLFVYFFVHIYLHIDQVKQMHAAAFYFLFIAPPMLGVLNLVWFHKIAFGLVKAIRKKQL